MLFVKYKLFAIKIVCVKYKYCPCLVEYCLPVMRKCGIYIRKLEFLKATHSVL